MIVLLLMNPMKLLGIFMFWVFGTFNRNGYINRISLVFNSYVPQLDMSRAYLKHGIVVSLGQLKRVFKGEWVKVSQQNTDILDDLS